MSRILENNDIFRTLVSEWLDIKDVVNLDSVMIGSIRDTYKVSLQSADFPVPFANRSDLWWKNHKACLNWLISRQISCKAGKLIINRLIWEHYWTREAEKFGLFLKNIKSIRFESFNNDHTIPHLEKCTRLTQLEIFNFRPTDPCETPFCPKLEYLFLQSCQINDNLISYFLNCPNLKRVTIKHGTFAPNLNQESFRRFLQTVERVTILGEVQNFLENISNFKNNFKIARFDKGHKYDTSKTINWGAFFSNSPLLQNLSVERLDLHFAPFIHALSNCESTKSLTILHLNQCYFSDFGEGFIDARVPNITNLTVSTPLPESTDVRLILNPFSSNLRSLNLSFCENLQASDYRHIAEHSRLLNNFHINGLEEIWFNQNKNAENTAKKEAIASAFSFVPLVKVQIWKLWGLFNEDLLLQGENTVIYERNGLSFD